MSAAIEPPFELPEVDPGSLIIRVELFENEVHVESGGRLNLCDVEQDPLYAWLRAVRHAYDTAAPGYHRSMRFAQRARSLAT